MQAKFVAMSCVDWTIRALVPIALDASNVRAEVLRYLAKVTGYSTAERARLAVLAFADSCDPSVANVCYDAAAAAAHASNAEYADAVRRVAQAIQKTFLAVRNNDRAVDALRNAMESNWNILLAVPGSSSAKRRGFKDGLGTFSRGRSKLVFPPPAGQYDWIGGFADGTALKLEAFLTPVMFCLDRDGTSGTPVCESFSRVGERQINVPIELGSVGRLEHGSCYLLRRKLGPLPPSLQPKTDVIDYLDHISSCWDFDDDSSEVLTFRDIQTGRPEIAQLIQDYRPCPPSVSFFILEGRSTLVMPTSQLLYAFYYTSGPRLKNYWLSGRGNAQYEDASIHFTGLRYGYRDNSSSEIDAELVKCNKVRAEHELSQVLPRAAAYSHRHRNSIMPLLIRPPFTGVMHVGGFGKTLSGSRPVTLVLDRLNVHLPNEHDPCQVNWPEGEVILRQAG